MMRILAAWWFAMFMLSAADSPWTPAYYHQQVQQLSRALQTGDEVKTVALAKGIALDSKCPVEAFQSVRSIRRGDR